MSSTNHTMYLSPPLSLPESISDEELEEAVLCFDRTIAQLLQDLRSEYYYPCAMCVDQFVREQHQIKESLHSRWFHLETMCVR